MLLPALHLLTSCVTLSRSYVFPGTRKSVKYRGSFPDLIVYDSEYYNVLCNLLNSLEAGPTHGSDYCLREGQGGGVARQRQQNRKLPQNRPVELPGSGD